MRDFVAAQARAIPPSGIRKFFDLVQDREDIVSLGVGEPDFATPWNICEAAIYSIEQGSTSYTANRGMPALCREIARYLDDRFSILYSPETEIMVTSGVSEAFDVAIRTVVDPGDEVIVAEPSFVAYSPCVMLAGGTPVPVQCRGEDEFRLTADALSEAVTPKTKAVVINFPNNPTGGVMRDADYRAIAEVIVDHDLLLISDEIYAELTYEGSHTSAVTVDDLRERTITLNGFSKAYAMTGWRIGFLCAPKEICDAAMKIHQYVMMCAPAMAQVAAIEALRRGSRERDAMVREYCIRRNLFVRGLNRIGLPCHMPKGAFYAFPSVAETGLSDLEFAERLLTEQGVAVVPGRAFGTSAGGYLRCAYAVSRENLRVGLDRMEAFLTGL
ncbi:MAG: aminotransferase class I/II-fold pyridoxal phosphate-dependent enzyme [Methanomicrobiaceae archaeon]|nr:aminotransferase class I/II-fold pyridoxal phosphate-dependent enzyme [Methanomicrobiaceae archaeon]